LSSCESIIAAEQRPGNIPAVVRRLAADPLGFRREVVPLATGSYARQVTRKPRVVDHYGAHYRDFAADVYGDVRREAFGVDIGQKAG
jgi:hypothetical protein